MTLTVAPATPADAGELFTVQRAAFLDEARELGTMFIPPLNETLDELRAAFDEVMIRKALDGTRIVGCGRLRVSGANGETGWIERLAIAPDWQGRGVGSAIMVALEAGAPASVNRFEVHTAAVRTQNLAFYRRHGYTRAGEFTDPAGIIVAHLEKRRPPAD